MLRNLTVLLFLSLIMTACDEQVPRSYFAANGITPGEPVWKGDQVFVPIDFQSDIVHSAQWLHEVEVEVQAQELLLLARITKPPNGKATTYPGGIFLTSPAAGTYDITYEDPDGTRHPIGTIQIPESP